MASPNAIAKRRREFIFSYLPAHFSIGERMPLFIILPFMEKLLEKCGCAA